MFDDPVALCFRRLQRRPQGSLGPVGLGELAVTEVAHPSASTHKLTLSASGHARLQVAPPLLQRNGRLFHLGQLGRRRLAFLFQRHNSVRQLFDVVRLVLQSRSLDIEVPVRDPRGP